MRKVFPKIKYASIGDLSIAYQGWGKSIWVFTCPHMIPEMKEAIVKFDRMTCNPETLANMIGNDMKIDIHAILSEIKTSTLVCRGRDDWTLCQVLSS